MSETGDKDKSITPSIKVRPVGQEGGLREPVRRIPPITTNHLSGRTQLTTDTAQQDHHLNKR